MFNRKAFPWRTQGGGAETQPFLSAEELQAEVEQDMGMKLDASRLSKEFKPPSRLPVEKRQHILRTSRFSSEIDFADSEGGLLCAHCGLPLGEIRYAASDSMHRRLHGECMAQRMLSHLRGEVKLRREKEAKLKSSRREEYDIGWKVARIPPNIGVAEKMGCLLEPKGMVCLRVLGNECTVSIVPTLEPAGSVNLQYLSISLKVRRKEGREPFFSLDPVDPQKLDSMQVKCFEPDWLVGTCVGDVLFQADYHLKELSMGEYEQPVVGMRSCFDFSFEEDYDKEWNAREWFVVRKAEVHLSEDNVVIPHVRMGVEAWEQHVDADGKLQDSKVTRANHPLQRYAEAFTHNFDLIAERKSVIFNLRELAKASVLAKYIVDARVNVQQSWIDAVETPALTAKPVKLAGKSEPDKSLQIPQLWNQRYYGKIQVEKGTIVEDKGGIQAKAHGVYGGVNFGLDRFSVAAPGRVSRSMLDGMAGRPAAASMLSSISAIRAQASISAAHLPARRVLGTDVVSAIAGRAEPRGVDLNLSKFDLSKATRVTSQASAVQAGEDACAAIGNEFWENNDSCNASLFKDKDRTLLAGLFNPHLSDRREEADQFVPPDTSKAYLERLTNLLKEEDSARNRRKSNFFSMMFNVHEPGPLFPSSWKDYIEIERTHIPQEGILHERCDYKAESQMFDHVLQSAIPVFDKSTEEGIRYRVYNVGSIEVRTTQEHNAKEIVGAVFSRRAPTQSPTKAKQGRKEKVAVKDSETVNKVTIYVEKDSQWLTTHRYYVVIETEGPNVIVSEQLRDGNVTWKENPADLEDRNSLAKAYCSKDCLSKGMTVEDFKAYSGRAGNRLPTLDSKGKRYAQGAYNKARGEAADAKATVECVSPELLKKPNTALGSLQRPKPAALSRRSYKSLLSPH